MTKVTVTITGKVTGTAFIAPFSFAQGLQKYPVGHAKEGQTVVYEINKYAVKVDGGGTYDAVRFGLQNKGGLQSSRVSDAGLIQYRKVHPGWVEGYSPHSFTGRHVKGAWRIVPGKSFLIHEGGDSGIGQIGGSLGCVEVLDGKWNTFMDELNSITGQPWAAIASKRLMNLIVEAASYPTARLI